MTRAYGIRRRWCRNGALEGRGIGAALARSGLHFAQAQGLAVRPLCPFVAAYFAKHPEYGTLVR